MASETISKHLNFLGSMPQPHPPDLKYLVLYMTEVYVYVLHCSSNNTFEAMFAIYTTAVSELPGYPGWRHARQSHYVTAEFPW